MLVRRPLRIGILVFIALTMTVNGYAAGHNHRDTSLFRMMIRLWPEHHMDPELSQQLIDALLQYDFCDEVWFCGSLPATRCLAFHDSSATQMGIIADRLRRIGIIPSLQVVVIGHGDSATVFSPDGYQKDSTIHWGTMVGANGEKTMSVNCPRQEAYLAFMEKAFVPYAKACQPYSLYLDDDMRMSQHPPAMEGCFCETCISLFNNEYGYDFNREALVEALDRNDGEGTLRRQWIAFGQESLANLARVIALSVHKVSPGTRVGLQHNYFHHNMLEGWDWIPMLKAMEEETGLVPPVRPGELFYSDASPRGILKKGLEIAREIRRLPDDVVEIAPEVEGYLHKATGKSAQGVCLETLYYLAMGATQMSYAIICSAEEPMDWYASHYFKSLAELKPFAKDYADFNLNAMPTGIDPYMSPNLCVRNVRPEERPWAWTYTNAGNTAFGIAHLGLPFAPEDPLSPVLMVDNECAAGMNDQETSELLTRKNIVTDAHTWSQWAQRGLLEGYLDVSPPIIDDVTIDGARLQRAWNQIALKISGSGRRIAVVPSFNSDINGAEQLVLSQVFDWASGNTLQAVLESVAQVAIVPRSDTQGRLRSVSLLSCSLAEEEHLKLRIRPFGTYDDRLPKKYVWKRPGKRDIWLKAKFEGTDVILDIPSLGGWEFGWIKIN